MVLTEQQVTRDVSETSVAPSKSMRKPGAAWPSAAQLRRSLPMMRLLAEIWSIPQVLKVGLESDGLGVHVWVMMQDDDLQAEATISAAERTYLNATSLHRFDLDVVPLSHVDESVLPSFETILAR